MKVFISKNFETFRPDFSDGLRFRGAVKNMILYTKDFKTFRDTSIVLSHEELQNFMKDKNLIYLGRPVKVRASCGFIATPRSVLYKNIAFTAHPENDYLSFLMVRFPVEDGKIDLDFAAEKVKELYPAVVTELPQKPLEELYLSEGFHGTYFVVEGTNKKIIITARGAIIVRKGYEEYPEELQKYIDYVLGLREADEEIIQTLTEFEKPHLFIETVGAVGGAEITLFRDTYNAKLYYTSEASILTKGPKERPVNFQWGSTDPMIRTEKKEVIIYSITASKKGITVDTLYLDGRWKITVPWDYRGQNPLTADTAKNLPPEIQKEPVYIIPTAREATYYQRYYYDTGYLEYDKETDTFTFESFDDGTEIELSRDVLEAAETIEEAIELQKFLQ